MSRGLRMRGKKKQATGMHIRATPVVYDGIRFDSKGEGDRYLQLKIMERAGEIRDLEVKPVFYFCLDDRWAVIRSKGYPNGRKVKHIADFAYFDMRRNKDIVEDYKGDIDDDKGRLKRAFVELIHGVRIELYPPRQGG